MNLKDFYFELPKELIAQSPLQDRSASRLLVLDKTTGAMEHKSFKDIIGLINKRDCIVLNETKVMPVRLHCLKKETGAKIELLLLKRLGEPDTWETLVKPGKRVKVGDKLIFQGASLEAEILGMGEDGKRIISFKYEGVFEEILDRLGEMPLPPYINEKLADKNRYQTVYAKNEGSSAAPTAGLHFTDDLLKTLTKKGVSIAKLTLHVGLGTFRPVKTENVLEHKMHSEYYEINADAANTINKVKRAGGRIIAVGTTSLRAMESCADNDGFLTPQAAETNIFIYPGYKFKITDCLITNFHLPESTLIMLVSALAGRNNALNAYNGAIKEGYRFFSFGDAMFITSGIKTE